VLRLVYELGMQLQMRQCDCNGAAVCTFFAAVIVVCLVRYAMLAVLSWYLLSVYGLIVFLDCCEWRYVNVLF